MEFLSVLSHSLDRRMGSEHSGTLKSGLKESQCFKKVHTENISLHRTYVFINICISFCEHTPDIRSCSVLQCVTYRRELRINSAVFVVNLRDSQVHLAGMVGIRK